MTAPSLPSPLDDAFTSTGDGEARAPAHLLNAQAQPSDPPPAPEGEPAQEEFTALELNDRVVISLLFHERVRIEQVQAAWRRVRQAGGGADPTHLWRALAEEPGVDREAVFEAAAWAFAFKTGSVPRFSALACLRRASGLFPKEQYEQMLELGVLPVAVSEDGRGEGPRKSGSRSTERAARRWVFGAYDPTAVEVQRFMRVLGLQYYDLVYLPETEVRALVAEARTMRNEYLDRVRDADAPLDLDVVTGENGSIRDEDLEAEITSSALINLFEAALVEAVRRGASDVHICPDEAGHIAVYFRIDGELTCWYVEDRAQPEAFLAVAKDRTHGVDRFARDRGQDGYLQRTVDGALIRFRVSVLPLAHASQQARYESVVIRVLDDRRVVGRLADLGLSERGLALLEEAIRQPQGMVIITGPTGSGKSTTLYAALHEVRSPKRNVLTAEDPVEYVLPGVRQIKLSHKLPVQEALRFVLRHDPDVVMVGEMRDRDTAELGIQLANTGHLTFSTLHTNDAASAVIRLYKMGVEPFLIAHAVHLVVAQRLVRTLCPDCKVPDDTMSAEDLRAIGFSAEEAEAVTPFRPGPDSGCRTCKGNGYRGRRAVVEVMPVTQGLRRLIIAGEGNLDEDALRAQAVADQMVTLAEAARELVAEGVTSVEEVIRAVGRPR
jgi:type IV pilus assembly protein PilB